MTRRYQWWLLGALLLLAAGVIGFLVAWKLKPQRKQELSAQTVVTQIRRIAKLATVEAQEAQILKVDESTPVFYLFESRKNALLLVKGKVIAGVDLEKADIQVTESPLGKTIRVTLPPAEILAIDPSVEFYSEQNGWLNPITPQDRTAWLKLARRELETAAEAGDVRTRASLQAQRLITGLGAALGYQVVLEGAVVKGTLPEVPLEPLAGD